MPKKLPGNEYIGESKLPYTLVSSDSLVENTSGSFDLPVINIPGILDFLVYLVPELELVYSLLVSNTTGSHDSTVYLSQDVGCLKCLAPTSVFANQFWFTPWSGLQT
jgi:hypothetical protein